MEITSEDIVDFLSKTEPEQIEDQELEELYTRIHNQYTSYLKEGHETDLGMAGYYVTQYWIVEDDINKHKKENDCQRM